MVCLLFVTIAVEQLSMDKMHFRATFKMVSAHFALCLVDAPQLLLMSYHYCWW
jgi:hypothetical protein